MHPVELLPGIDPSLRAARRPPPERGLSHHEKLVEPPCNCRLGDALGSQQLENKIRNQRFERTDIERIEKPEVAKSATNSSALEREKFLDGVAQIGQRRKD